MTIEDAVEDYLIYAYFELDHPRRCYVGKTLQSRAEQRDQEHRSGESGAKKFNAFVKNEIIYGDRDFDDVLDYKILEQFTGTAKECAEREGEHIQRKNSIENGWNLKPEGTGTGLLFPSPTTGANRPPIRRSRLHIQGDLGGELIQDVIEFGLEQSILEKDKEYNFQELKMLIAKSYAAQTYQTLNQTLNIPNKEPSPNEVMSVVNTWKSNGDFKVWKHFDHADQEWKSGGWKDKGGGGWCEDREQWWEEQLTKSGFGHPFDWNVILTTICQLFEKAELNSPLIQWLEGNRAVLNLKSLPELNRKWVCYGGSEDVWRLIRSAFLAKFPNTLQEIEEKEEQKRREKEERERIQREREEAERLQREREEKEEAIGKVAERMEKERIQRVAQAKPDLAIIEKQVTRAGSGGCGCIIFSIISIIFIICVLVSCIEY